MSYSVEAPGESWTFDDGTNLLVSGETKPARERLFDALAEGLADGETVILVTTDESASSAVEELAERGELASDRLGIVDVTSEGGPGHVDGVRVCRLSSAGDLTGMSLEFAKLLEEFESNGVATDVRVGVSSVSTLLMYADVKTVFRFLHVFTSRIQSARLFGLFTLHPSMHDGKTTNTLRAIFDCEADVSETDVELRGSGFLPA